VNGRILKMMGRPGNVKNIVAGLKNEIPGLALRTTLIVGFPGETKKEFNELAGFVSEGWFDHLGVFEYSPAAGAQASSLRGKVSGRVKRERRNELMLRQKKVVAAKNRALIGTTAEALVETVNPVRDTSTRLSSKIDDKQVSANIPGKTIEGSPRQIWAVSNGVKNNNTCTGRAVFQAPEIDGGIIIEGACKPGSFVKAKITGFKGYDLKAEL
jgi:tRNA A37 methylthiotransferase MiaB